MASTQETQEVFDSLDEYEKFRQTGGDILNPATKKAKEEALEEAGVRINSLEFFKRSVLGATVEWDLFVFETKDWEPSEGGQQLEDGEEIEADTWVSFDEAENLALNGGMREERIAFVLLQWIHRQRSKV